MTPSQVEMFAGPAAQAHAAMIRLLVPVARELEAKHGTFGVTVSDLRFTAARRGLIPNVGRGRELSYLGAVMRAAGLVPTGERRRSLIPEAHGNLNTVWRRLTAEDAAEADEASRLVPGDIALAPDALG